MFNVIQYILLDKQALLDDKVEVTYSYASENKCNNFRFYRLMIKHSLRDVSRVRHVPLTLTNGFNTTEATKYPIWAMLSADITCS